MARDPYRYFRVEARDLVEQMAQGALDLERGGDPSEVVARLLRLAHTLKGAARVVKHREIADGAHAIEGVLAPFRESTDAAPAECTQQVLTLVDQLEASVGGLPVAAESDSTVSKRPAAEAQFQTVRADIAEMDALLDGLGETHSQMKTLRRTLTAASHARGLVERLSDQRIAELRDDRALGTGTDRMVAIADELRSTVSGLERALSTSLDQMDRELTQVHSLAEQMRLLPAGMLFTSLERTVRDTAHAAGKRVDFERIGADVRLDAHVLGSVQNALIQVMRNAVVHGVEAPAVRLAAGKPAVGRVTLSVTRRGRKVLFRCVDDGQGVDLDAVRRAVQHRGIQATEAEPLDERALLRHLMMGGISTSPAVSEIAGRGIGLNLVREVVERLAGEVDVQTTAGRGTTVDLVVPLSIASVDAIVVESAGMTVSIPMETVRRSTRVAAADVMRSAQGDSVLDDGEVIPLVDLSRILRPAAAPVERRPSWSTVIVESDVARVAFGVDRIVGAMTIVFRALPELAPAPPIVAGASLNAEGNPQLVLDAEALVAWARYAGAAAVPAPLRRFPILIVDDSLTTRMLEQSILESAGFVVGVAASAEEGLELARSRRFGLFLVDVDMPGMDGFTFVERIRADPQLRDIPAMLVTSRDHPDDRRRGTAVGAQGYIIKGEFDQVAFLDQIRRLMAG